MAKLKVKDLTIYLGNERVVENVDLELNATEIVGMIMPNLVEQQSFFNNLTSIFPEEFQPSQNPLIKKLLFLADSSKLQVNVPLHDMLSCLQTKEQNRHSLENFFAGDITASHQKAMDNSVFSNVTQLPLSISGYLMSEVPILIINQALAGSSYSSIKQVISTFSHSKRQSKIIFFSANYPNSIQIISDRVLQLKHQKILLTQQSASTTIFAQRFNEAKQFQDSPQNIARYG